MDMPAPDVATATARVEVRLPDSHRIETMTVGALEASAQASQLSRAAAEETVRAAKLNEEAANERWQSAGYALELERVRG